MKLSSLILASTMSLVPVEENCMAKNDIDPNARWITSSSKTVEDQNNKAIGDIYSLNFYLEETTNEAIPLSLITSPIIVQFPSKISFSTEDYLIETYETSSALKGKLDASAEGKVNFLNLIELQANASASAEAEYQSSLSISSINIAKQTIEVDVDGNQNKLGVYAFVYCATSAYKFYVSYTHNRFFNYNQQELYKTWLLKENADCHIYLPINPTRNVNSIYYFETIEEYNNFCEQWNL